MENYSDIKQSEKGAWLSLFAYILLSAVKLFIASVSGSQALLADGLNNSTDIIASLAILTGLKISRRPPDSNHSYGHFRAETVAALIASFIMIAVGLQVLYQGVNKFAQYGAGNARSYRCLDGCGLCVGDAGRLRVQYQACP